MTIPRLSALILLVSVAAGGVVALAAPPPGSRTRSASVVVWPVQPDELQAAALPTLAVPEQGGRAQFAPGPSGSGRFAASAESDEAALASALAAARSYVRTLMAAQNRWIVGSQKSSRPSLQRRRARQSLLGAPQRYMLIYDEPRLGPTSGGAPFRGGLVGILVGGLAVATLEGRRPRRPRRTTGAVESRLRALLLAAVPLLLAAASSGLLVAATSAGPTDLYPLVVIGILFASASLYAFHAGEHGVRLVLATIVAVSPMRGALLALAGVVHLPQALVTVNALQPCMVAATGLVALLDFPRLLRRTARPLLIAWVTIAGVAMADATTQTVGLKVYAIGLVQYLVYPTFAVVAWPVLRGRDVEPLAVALVALAVAVACSIFLEAAHLVRFVEAVPPIDPVTGTARYGGSTGSYLHASIFLGTAAPVALGFVLAKKLLQRGLAAVALVAILAGFLLTYSRGGFAITAASVLVLLFVLHGRQRVRLAATAAAAVALALPAGFVAGISPAKVGDRMASALSVHGDPANSRRLHDMRAALRRFGRASISQKVFGQGLAATGNTRKLAGLQPVSTESYVLKLLVEVGVVGLLAIGAVLAWGVFVLSRLAWRARERPDLQCLAAAGIGLSLYALVFPTLEAQLTALTWWLLLVLALKALETPALAKRVR